MSDLTVVINLFIAFLLGGAIGWLREKEGKSAGLRTHILVCVGSALFTLISANIFFAASVGDPARIAAGVVTGIGFLGAGAIVQGKNFNRGITTAASIWVTAAIGIASGIGFYVGAVAATIIAVITLEPLGRLEKKILKDKESSE